MNTEKTRLIEKRNKEILKEYRRIYDPRIKKYALYEELSKQFKVSGLLLTAAFKTPTEKNSQVNLVPARRSVTVFKIF